MKADPQAQGRLLELQSLDTKLDQLAHARSHLPQEAGVLELENNLRVVSDQLVRSQTELSDIRRDVDKAEADVQQVRDRAARDQARLDSGTGAPKELAALQHELATLAKRQSDLEDVELEVMERAEALEHDVAELERGKADATARLEELTAERDAALAKLDAQAAEVAAPRDRLVADVGPDLMELYEKIRASSGGIGAAELTQRRCQGCRLELNPVDLQRIAAAEPDEVVRCEECRRILIRTPESGL